MDYILRFSPDTISGSLIVTVVGLVFVFAVLLILMVVLYLMPYIAGNALRKEKSKHVDELLREEPSNISVTPPITNNVTVIELTDQNKSEIIAVITAAILCMQGGNSRYNIKSFRQVGGWRAASIRNQLENLK